MNDLRHMLEDDSAVRSARAGGASRRRSIARRLMSRVLPGGMVVVAALTVPELSVGAGDLGGGNHVDDPPLPPSPSLKQTTTTRLGAARAKPGLAGVRYAPVIDREAAPVLTLTAAMALPGAGEADVPLLAPAPLSAAVAAPVAASLPLEAAPPPALVPPPVVPPVVKTPNAAEAAPVAAIATPSAMPLSAPPTMPAASLPTASELAAAAVPAPVLPMSAGLDQPAQAPTAKVAMAVAPSEPVADPPRIAAIAAPGPAGRGVLPESADASPVSRPAPAPAPRAAAPLPPRQPAAGLRAAVAAPPPVQAPAPAIAAVPLSRPALSAPLAAGNSPFPLDIKAQLITRVDGKTAGTVDFQQTPEGLKLRLGSVVEVLADRFAPDVIARIRASSAGEAYVSLADLQARGIPISYDPVYDEFNVGLTDTRPKSARKVHIDQITTPERGIDATGMAQVPRPR
ncbi:hypothetical protein [Porphyrobacter sp. YT40]|uniref:hypothetical protein n=1 Tax=Porphyrobacter sp. YT40 TaxID=2547601 RepID=UPI0011428B00|nr:hypothetical protein [Porphyrobacter sp. YT40]QDH33632.1 hypothetical protein E2E27_04330 [Porphyrobacter sp. YT40]